MFRTPFLFAQDLEQLVEIRYALRLLVIGERSTRPAHVIITIILYGKRYVHRGQKVAR